MRADVAVVGSGLAALIATRSLQKAGRKPVLIWPGLSSLYFVYATVDVLGYSDATSRQPVEHPGTGVAALIADHPDHPYARAGLEALRGEVVEQIRDKAAPHSDHVRVGVPAVLGLTHDTDVYQRFQSELGHPVFEIPTLPPSVLGLRLFDRLRKHLQETGVEIIWAAQAHAAELSDGRCRRIHLKSAGREQPIEAGAYVLALEDMVDGALRAGVHAVVDPFFHQSLADHVVPTERTDEALLKPQPFASIGYGVTDRLQPAAGDGNPLARNVFLAGGAIAGYDPVGTKSRGGLAIATGYRAAKEAMAA